MPQVRASLIDKLLAASILRAVRGGDPGDRRQARQSSGLVAALLPGLMAIEGDVGARNMIARYPKPSPKCRSRYAALVRCRHARGAGRGERLNSNAPDISGAHVAMVTPV